MSKRLERMHTTLFVAKLFCIVKHSVDMNITEIEEQDFHLKHQGVFKMSKIYPSLSSF